MFRYLDFYTTSQTLRILSQQYLLPLIELQTTTIGNLEELPLSSMQKEKVLIDTNSLSASLSPQAWIAIRLYSVHFKFIKLFQLPNLNCNKIVFNSFFKLIKLFQLPNFSSLLTRQPIRRMSGAEISSLGTGQATKKDEFSGKFRTAFEPSPPLIFGKFLTPVPKILNSWSKSD